MNEARKHLRGICFDSLDSLTGDNYEVFLSLLVIGPTSNSQFLLTRFKHIFLHKTFGLRCVFV